MYSTAGSEPATRFVGKIHRIKRWFPLPRATHFQNLPENTLTILNLSNVGRRNSYCLKYNRASTKTCVSNKKVVYSNVYVYASQTLWNSESKINYGVRSKKYWFWASGSGRVLFSNPGTSFLFFFCRTGMSIISSLSFPKYIGRVSIFAHEFASVYLSRPIVYHHPTHPVSQIHRCNTLWTIYLGNAGHA